MAQTSNIERRVSQGSYAGVRPQIRSNSQGGKTLHLRFALPQSVVTRVEDFQVDGKPAGKVLRATPAAPSERARFVAVLSQDVCPDLQATESEGAVKVSLPGGAEVSFDADTGEATAVAP